MRLTCPCCGATLSLEALLNDTAARQAVATALSLPADLGPRLLRYLGLFRPAQRSLTWERAAGLLTELQALIAAGQITRHGRHWPTSPATWSAALDEMLDRRPNLTLPLKGHGYLLEILAGMANSAEAQHEQRIEDQRRQPRPDTGSGMQSVQALMAQIPPGPPLPKGGDPEADFNPSLKKGGGDAGRISRPPRSAPSAEFRALKQKLTGQPPDPAPETPP